MGAYEVVDRLGAGGMGELYRARDLRLQRHVALKILPESVARDADRLARFTREAQTLAALNHPNIAAIYGIEDSGPVRAIAMEMVEGDDLLVRIGRGALPVDEALSIARQIAQAARRWNRAPGSQAGKCHGPRRRDREGARLRSREDGAGGTPECAGRPAKFANADVAADDRCRHASPQIGKPEVMFGADRLEVSQYAIARDGRLLVAVEDPASRRARTVLVQNWPALAAAQ